MISFHMALKVVVPNRYLFPIANGRAEYQKGWCGERGASVKTSGIVIIITDVELIGAIPVCQIWTIAKKEPTRPKS